MTEKISSIYRNPYGTDVTDSTRGTEYRDFETINETRDYPMGATNGKVIAISMIRAGLLLLPIDLGKKTHRIVYDDRPANILAGHKLCNIQFNPFDETYFAGHAETKTGSRSVKLFYGKYDPECMDDINKLNQSVEIFCDITVHQKRSAEIIWNPYVKDLLYSAGGDEIYALKMSEDEPSVVTTYKIGTSGSDVLNDISLSSDGKFLAGSFTRKGSDGASEQVIAIYEADKISDEDYEEPVTIFQLSSDTSARCSFISADTIIAGGGNLGKRHLTSFKFDHSTRTLEKSKSASFPTDHTSVSRVNPLGWEKIFFTFAKGDSKISMYCEEDGEIIKMGEYSAKKGILGVIYFDSSFIDPHKYELGRFCIATGTTRSTSLVMGVLGLNRASSFENSNIYKSMASHEPSMTCDEFIENGKNLKIKTIHPLDEYEEFMSYNEILRDNTVQTIGRSLKKKSPLGTLKSAKPKSTVSETKSAPKEAPSVQIKKSEPVDSGKSHTFDYKSQVVLKSATNGPTDANTTTSLAGKEIEIKTVDLPVRKVSVTSSEFSELKEKVESLESTVRKSEECIKTLLEKIEELEGQSVKKSLYISSETDDNDN